MEQFAKAKSFWEKNQKTLTIVIGCVLAVCFVGSVLFSIFIGGEFAPSDHSDSSVKGLLRIEEAEYTTEYAAGDTFQFNDETCVISLIAKDPAIENLVKDISGN